jgi:hypothetical protein
VFLQASALDDESLILKTILWEGFAGARFDRGQSTPNVANYNNRCYTGIDPEELNKRRALDLRSVQTAVGEAVPLPPLSLRERYRFSIRLTPTIRVTESEGRRHGEQDAFLAKADTVGKHAGVYRDYLAQRLVDATIEVSRLVQFRLRKFMRPKTDGSVSGKTVPEAVIEGRLRVDDPSKLLDAIGGGIGRQRAYGCGMLRLQPP